MKINYIKAIGLFMILIVFSGTLSLGLHLVFTILNICEIDILLIVGSILFTSSKKM